MRKDQTDDKLIPALLNTLITIFLFLTVYVYMQKLKIQQNINIPEFNQNTTPIELQHDATDEQNEDRPPSYSELYQPTSQEKL
jgi:hypothetical protein